MDNQIAQNAAILHAQYQGTLQKADFSLSEEDDKATDEDEEVKFVGLRSSELEETSADRRLQH